MCKQIGNLEETTAPNQRLSARRCLLHGGLPDDRRLPGLKGPPANESRRRHAEDLAGSSAKSTRVVSMANAYNNDK